MLIIVKLNKKTIKSQIETRRVNGKSSFKNAKRYQTHIEK